MRGEFELIVPDAVEAKITITATIGQWRELLTATDDISKYPLGDFRSVVRNAIYAAEKTFLATAGEKRP